MLLIHLPIYAQIRIMLIVQYLELVAVTSPFAIFYVGFKTVSDFEGLFRCILWGTLKIHKRIPQVFFLNLNQPQRLSNV